MKKRPNRHKVLILTNENIRVSSASCLSTLTHCIMCGEPMRNTRFMHETPCWSNSSVLEKKKAEAILELLETGEANYIILDLESRQFVSKK